MSHRWLLFLPQLPSSPSSLRVLVWRRMRAAGATGLQNGVWVFPHMPEHERFVRDLLSEVEPQGGRGVLLAATTLDPATDQNIIEQFQAERDQEYAEFCEQCGEFLREIEKETQVEKFIFAELEENEEDLNKLVDWLQKIKGRDFFTGHQAGAAEAALAECKHALGNFTQVVYARAGLNSPENGAGK
jgi:hypothetical protein